jgi:hypothetical protein
VLFVLFVAKKTHAELGRAQRIAKQFICTICIYFPIRGIRVIRG